jgi:hypothetical protein
VSLLNFRKDIYHRALQPAGRQSALRGTCSAAGCPSSSRCPTRANANAVAFETIVLQNEGFARDEAVVETAEF